MKIKYVNGFKIRNSLDADFGVIGSNAIYSYIPKGEIWFDKLYAEEKKHFLKIHLFELKLLKKMSYEKARPLVVMKFIVKKKINEKDFVMRKINYKGFVVRYVDGGIVRKFLDPKFIFGCHWVLNKKIRKKVIWIDIRQDKKEYKFTLLHEWFEAYLMLRGMSYNNAHDYALAAEKVLRRKFGARYLKD